MALPITTTTLSRRLWLSIYAMRSGKRLSVPTFAHPQPCRASVPLSPFGISHLLLCHPWLRSPSLSLSMFCRWVRLSAIRLPLDLDQSQPIALYGTCLWTQAFSLPSPLPQALLLKAPPSGFQLSVLKTASWRTHLVACPWTTSRSTHPQTRLLLILHLPLPIRNLNKRPRKPSIAHWRFCSGPLRHQRWKREKSRLSPVRRRLQHPCRCPIRQATVAIAAAAGRELLRTIPWKRPPHRTSRSTCRSPSEAFQGDRSPSSPSSPADCDDSQPNLPPSGPIRQGAARSFDKPEECWMRLSKCAVGSRMSVRQVACIAFLKPGLLCII